MHTILEKAKRYLHPMEDKSPKGYSYNKIEGYWMSDDTSDALVYSGDMIGLATKKEDIETGEDQKGE